MSPIGQMWPSNVLWRLHARDSAGNESEWSDEWNFTILNCLAGVSTKSRYWLKCIADTRPTRCTIGEFSELFQWQRYLQPAAA